jgi:histidinol-phosphatase
MNPAELMALERFAEYITLEASKIILDAYRGDLQVETKADHSPVTIADRKAEERLRYLIEKEFPTYGIIGEEFGETRPDAEYRWILDPIDGTRPFLAGVPQYTVLVALEHQKDSLLGVIHNPGLQRTLIASRGNGARLDGTPVHVSQVSDLSQASVLCSSYSGLMKAHPGKCTKILQTCRFAPGWGDGFGYLLVAQGKCDAMLDWGWNVWDAAPIKVCIEEAGGRFTDWEGVPTIYGKSGVAANPRLHGQLMEILGDPTL